MKRSTLVAAIAVVGFSLTFGMAAEVNFSGDWVLSRRIPSFGAKTPNVILAIRQMGNDFAVTRTLMDEDQTIESHYTLDGNENINIVPNAAGRLAVHSTSTWKDGVLVLEGWSTFAGPEKDVITKWKMEYALSDNGDILTTTETHPTPFSEAVISQVFNRKSSQE